MKNLSSIFLPLLIFSSFICSCNESIPYLETRPKRIIAKVERSEIKEKKVVNLITPGIIMSFADIEPYNSWKEQLILEDFFISYNDKNRNGRFDGCDELDGTHFKLDGKPYHQYWKCK